MSEEEVAGAKLEMNRQAGNLVVPRNAVANPIRYAGVLFESEVEQVPDDSVVHTDVESLIGRADEAELADVGLDRLGGVEDFPIALPVVELRINLFGIQRTDPKA